MATQTMATRSAGNMRAIPDRTPRRSMWRSIAQTLKLLVLLVVVTGVGLVAGALIMSPAVSKEQRIMGAMGLTAFALLVALGYGVMRVVAWTRDALRQRRLRNTRATAMPSMNMRGAGKSKAPHTVQALAAAGAAPTEIARKMGLPVDAVAMLLQISGPAVVAR